jgi:hypothetical protein
MSKTHHNLCVSLSALYAVLLWLGLAELVSNKLTIWSHLGASEKFWTIFASAYACALAGSGVLYWMTTRRVVGFIHGALMLGIACLVIFGLMRDGLSSPGSDNAAAGILAAANFAFVVGGAMAAICGIGVLASVFSEPKALEEETHEA